MRRSMLWALSCLCMASGHAALLGADAPRQEIDVAPPASADVAQAIAFELPGDQRLRYGVIPSSIQLGDDGLVRYVLVATSRSGGQNILFEALDCKRGESKTLARWSAYQSSWRALATPRWVDINDARNAASRVLYGGVFCLNGLNQPSVEAMRRELQGQ